ncbi:MAG: hypothetical protein EXQ81_01250 [Thermoleophilia bacterium]|nr:hypothetical protein [Thermoleophilia bacterium]
MKRVALGAILVIAIAAGFGAYAATTGDDDTPKAGVPPIGLLKCRADDPNCLARIGGQDGDVTGDPDAQGGGAADSCLVGTNCDDTPETPTQSEGKPVEPETGTEPPTLLGACAPETPDCVDTATTTISEGE